MGVAPSQEIDYAELLHRIQVGDSTALKELSRAFSRGIRFLLSRNFQPDAVEVELQHTLSTVIRAVEEGNLSEPAQLVRFILLTIKQRSELDQQNNLGKHKIVRLWNRRVPPEFYCDLSSKAKSIGKFLRMMSAREQDVVRQYYVDCQSQEAICHYQSLSVSEFTDILTKIRSQFISAK